LISIRTSDIIRGMSLRPTLLCAIAATVVLRTAPAPVVQTEVRFVQAARWLDPVSGVLHGPVVVQISHGRIEKITAPDTPAPAAVRDFGDVTLMPGLVDAHVHLGIGGRPEATALADLRAGCCR
jgi:imidazolonepropionase-like amidohydrolase